MRLYLMNLAILVLLISPLAGYAGPGDGDQKAPKPRQEEPKIPRVAAGCLPGSSAMSCHRGYVREEFSLPEKTLFSVYEQDTKPAAEVLPRVVLVDREESGDGPPDFIRFFKDEDSAKAEEEPVAEEPDLASLLWPDFYKKLSKEDSDRIKSKLRSILSPAAPTMSKEPMGDGLYPASRAGTDFITSEAWIKDAFCLAVKIPTGGELFSAFLTDIQGDETTNELLADMAKRLGEELGVSDIKMSVTLTTKGASVSYRIAGSSNGAVTVKKRLSEIKAMLGQEISEGESDPEISLVANGGFTYTLELPLDPASNIINTKNGELELGIERQVIQLRDVTISSDGDVSQPLPIGLDLVINDGTKIKVADQIDIPILNRHAFVLAWNMDEEGMPSFGIGVKDLSCDNISCTSQRRDGNTPGVFDTTCILEAVAKAYLGNGGAGELLNGLFTKIVAPKFSEYAKNKMAEIQKTRTCVRIPALNERFQDTDVTFRPGRTEIDSGRGIAHVSVDMHVGDCRSKFIDDAVQSLNAGVVGDIEEFLAWLDSDAAQKGIAEGFERHSRDIASAGGIGSKPNGIYDSDLLRGGISDAKLKEYMSDKMEEEDLTALTPFNMDVVNLLLSSVTNQFDGLRSIRLSPVGVHDGRVYAVAELEIAAAPFYGKVRLPAYLKFEDGRLVPYLIPEFDGNGADVKNTPMADAYLSIGKPSSADDYYKVPATVEQWAAKKYITKFLRFDEGEGAYRIWPERHRGRIYGNVEVTPLDNILFDEYGSIALDISINSLIHALPVDSETPGRPLWAFDKSVEWANRTLNPNKLFSVGQYVLIGWSEDKGK